MRRATIRCLKPGSVGIPATISRKLDSSQSVMNTAIFAPAGISAVAKPWRTLPWIVTSASAGCDVASVDASQPASSSAAAAVSRAWRPALLAAWRRCADTPCCCSRAKMVPASSWVCSALSPYRREMRAASTGGSAEAGTSMDTRAPPGSVRSSANSARGMLLGRVGWRAHHDGCSSGHNARCARGAAAGKNLGRAAASAASKHSRTCVIIACI